MEDYQEVVRVIEVPDGKTFEDLHHAILDSVDFDSTQLASFYVCNDNWEKKVEITLIDMEADEGDMTPVMRDTQLGTYINEQGQKLVYEYDFVLMWKFFLEVESIAEFTGIPDEYPQLVLSEGDAPGQYDAMDRYPSEITDEDAKFIRELETKNTSLFRHADEEFDSEADELGEDDELGFDEFGDDDDFSGGGRKGRGGEDDWY